MLIIYILRSDSSGVCSDFIEGHSVLGCNRVTYDEDFVVHGDVLHVLVLIGTVYPTTFT